MFVELPESDPSGSPVDIYTVLGSVDCNPIPLSMYNVHTMTHYSDVTIYDVIIGYIVVCLIDSMRCMK